MAIPKITVSLNVVTQANTAPCRGTLSKKKTYERGQAKKSGLIKCSLHFSGFRLLYYCMADLHPDKFLKCRVTTAVSQPEEEVVVGCFFLEKKKEKKSVA